MSEWRNQLLCGGFAALALCALAGCHTEGGEGGPGAADSASGVEEAGVGALDSNEDGDDAEPDGADSGEGGGLPEPICRAIAGWSGVGVAFEERTNQWGLDDVRGTRLAAVDLDGDSWPDLVARRGEGNNDPETGTRNLWVMLNRPLPDGGRTFVDFTEESNIDARPDGKRGRRIQLAVFGDVNNDGHIDAFTSAASYNAFAPGADDPGDRSELLLGDGTGRFVLATPQVLRAPFGNRRYNAPAASFADMNRDGALDLFVGYDIGPFGSPEPDSVYLGDGAGGFADATEALGLLSSPWSNTAAVLAGTAHRRTWGTAVCDLNNDGWPDLVGSSYGRAFNSLFLSNAVTQTPSWADASASSGVAADSDENWRTNYNAQCYCELNPQAEDCAQVPELPAFFVCTEGQQLRWNHATDRQPYRNAGNSFGAVCGDVNGDGALDLLTLEIRHWDVGPSSDASELLIGNGKGEFTRPGNASTGLLRDWGTDFFDEGDIHGALFDWDNDGRLDVLITSSDYPGTRGSLFWQQPSGTFSELPASAGFRPNRAQGIAIADFDGDGDLDIIVGHSLARCGDTGQCLDSERVRFFRNNVGQAVNSTAIRLRGGASSNRLAIGARVEIVAGGTTQVREISGGYGHGGVQPDLAAHFGLGSACTIDRIRVRWPDQQGTVEEFQNLPANWPMWIQQGEGEVRYSPPWSYSIGR